MYANAGAHGEEYAVPDLQFGQERSRKQLAFEEGIGETAEFGSGGYDAAIGAKRGHGFPGRQFSVAVTQAERTAVCRVGIEVGVLQSQGPDDFLLQLFRQCFAAADFKDASQQLEIGVGIMGALCGSWREMRCDAAALFHGRFGSPQKIFPRQQPALPCHIVFGRIAEIIGQATGVGQQVADGDSGAVVFPLEHMDFAPERFRQEGGDGRFKVQLVAADLLQDEGSDEQLGGARDEEWLIRLTISRTAGPACFALAHAEYKGWKLWLADGLPEYGLQLVGVHGGKLSANRCG